MTAPEINAARVSNEMGAPSSTVMDAKPACGECRAPMVLDTGARLFRCGCGTTHKATTEGRPLGRPGSFAEIAARAAAHNAFDALWFPLALGTAARMPATWGEKRRASEMRSAAYSWLAKYLGVEKSQAHMASLRVAACEAVIAAVKNTTQARVWDESLEG